MMPDSLQAKILRDRSPIIDVEHIYLFNKITLSRLFTEANFAVLNVGDIKNSYPINYWLRLALKNGRSGNILKYAVERTGLG